MPTVLPEADAKRLLHDVGIAVPQGVAVTDLADVPAGLREPLVVKAVSPTLVHKSDAGGVRVGVTHSSLADVTSQVRAAVEAAGHPVTGFLVEEMAPAGHEVVVGAVRSPDVGWTVMVGLGGIFVEVLADVAFGMVPVSEADVRDMVDSLRGKPVLEGVRGQVRADIDALVDLVVRFAGVGGLLTQLGPEVVEVDLNPVIVGGDSAVAVDARFVVDPDRREVAVAVTPPSAGVFDGLYRPEVVAVLGAKREGLNGANVFIRNMIQAGFPGRIVPVHPEAEAIEGLPTAATIGAIGETVDYAYVALPAGRVADALTADGASVRFAQVVSSGFSEVEGGEALERDLVARLHAQGTRVVGPNCLGTHSTHGRLTFIPNAPMHPGTAAVISQSGGLSVDILRLGSSRGLDFHSVTSIGNSADVTAAELVEHFLTDPSVTVIGLYLESLAAARAVFDTIRQHGRATKPIVLLAGGRTQDGSRAATSHTGSLSGNERLWPALARQGGMTLVDSIEDFVNVLLAFDTIDLDEGSVSGEVVLFGNGGGASVLAADALARRGLSTPQLPDAVVAALDGLGLPPGNGLTNPIDVPAGTLAVKGGRVAGDIVDVVLRGSAPTAIVTHLNVGIIQRNLGAALGDVTGRIIESIAEATKEHSAWQVLVLKGDGNADIDAEIAAHSRRAAVLGLPVFSTFEEAAEAIDALLAHRRRASESIDAPPALSPSSVLAREAANVH